MKIAWLVVFGEALKAEQLGLFGPAAASTRHRRPGPAKPAHGAGVGGQFNLFGGDPSHGGRLLKQTQTTAAGHQQSFWIDPTPQASAVPRPAPPAPVGDLVDRATERQRAQEPAQEPAQEHYTPQPVTPEHVQQLVDEQAAWQKQQDEARAALRAKRTATSASEGAPQAAPAPKPAQPPEEVPTGTTPKIDPKAKVEYGDTRVIPGTHTKKGHAIWTVVVGRYLSRPDYDRSARDAKKGDGYYSSYRGGGAVPGYIFGSPEAAHEFARRWAEGWDPPPKAKPAEPARQKMPPALRAAFDELEEGGKLWSAVGARFARQGDRLVRADGSPATPQDLAQLAADLTDEPAGHAPALSTTTPAPPAAPEAEPAPMEGWHIPRDPRALVDALTAAINEPRSRDQDAHRLLKAARDVAREARDGGDLALVSRAVTLINRAASEAQMLPADLLGLRQDEPAADPSHGGKLIQRKIVTKDGRSITYWIDPEVTAQLLADPKLLATAAPGLNDDYALGFVIHDSLEDAAADALDTWGRAYFDEPGVAAAIDSEILLRLRAAAEQHAAKPTPLSRFNPLNYYTPAAAPGATVDTATGTATWNQDYVVTPRQADADADTSDPAVLAALPVGTVLYRASDGWGFVQRPDGAGWSQFQRAAGGAPHRHLPTAIPAKMLAGKLVTRIPAGLAPPENTTPPQAPAPPKPPPKPQAPRQKGARPSAETEMGSVRTPKARERANAEALETIEKAVQAGRPLTDEERAKVARYSGKGGIGDSLNQYFTRPDVARSMWAILAHHGLRRGARVLEPACGAGVFLETAPEGTHVTGVEIDPEVALVAQALHGDRHEIHGQSFEQFAVAREGLGDDFDAVITNAPFCTRTGGGVRIHKPDVPGADAYFLDTALDQVGPGGLVAMIVHKGVMDNDGNAALRRRLLARAELVGAYRLPVEAFSHAGATVTSDVLVFRKRDDTVAATLLAGGDHVGRALGAYDDQTIDGQHFATRPDAVLGRTVANWRGADAVEGDAEAVAGQLHAAGTAAPSPKPLTVADVEAVAADNPPVAEALELGKRTTAEPKGHEPGDTMVIAGITYILTGQPPRWHRLDDVQDAHEILHGDDPAIVAAGDIGGRILALKEAVDRGDHLRARSLRPTVARDLHAWVETHGSPHRRRELRTLSEHHRHIAHLLGAVREDGTLSDLLTREPVAVVDVDRLDRTNLQAVAGHIATAAPRAEITPANIRHLWTGDATDDELVERLLETGDYLDVSRPGQRAVMAAEDYLTGDLFALRDRERAAVSVGDANTREVAAARLARVEARINERWKPIDDADIHMGSGFVPPSVVAAYLNSEEGRSRVFGWAGHPGTGQIGGTIAVELDRGLYVWRIPTRGGHVRTLTGVETQKERGEFNTEPLKLLNRFRLGQEERERAEAIDAHFAAWALASEHRDALEENYNRTFFGVVDRRYSTADLPIGGLGDEVKLHPYQAETIRWAADRGRGIIGLDVGLGKTFAAIALARHLRESGKASKPVVACPKSVAANWLREIERMQPGARVLLIGETTTRKVDADGNETITSKADSARVIGQKIADAAQNDYDLIIVTHPALRRIPLRPETVERHEREDFWSARGEAILEASGSAGEQDKAAKRLAKAKATYEAQRAQIQIGDTKAPVYWEDLGADALIVDEAHAFKGLTEIRSRFGGKPKYMGSTVLTQAAADMEMKLRVVRERRKPNETTAAHAARVQDSEAQGSGAYFLTATPIKNSPIDVYSMVKHIAPEEWARRHIRNAEEFVDRFCEIEPELVLTHDGTLESQPVTRGFKNLDELREIIDQTMRRRTAEDVGLKLPRAERNTVLVDMSDEQKDAYDRIREEAEASESPGAILASLMRMKQAAMDLTIHNADEHPDAWRRSPKYLAATQRVAAAVKAGAGGQIVFVDTNDSHERLATLLTERGIPRERIGIINAQVAPDSEDRYQISEAFRRGDLDVVIGNTETMGEGVNLQTRTSDIHHLDVRWNPGGMQQRDGRGLRQGNRNAKVRIHTYLAKGSFDGFAHGIMAGKRGWLSSMDSGAKRTRNDEAGAEFSADEMRVMLAKDPDAARAKMEAGRTEAAETIRQIAGAKATGRYERHQQDLAKLRKLADTTTDSARRLAQRAEDSARSIAADPHLPEKLRAALSRGEPAVVGPEQQILTVGTVFYEHSRSGHKADPLDEALIVTDVDPRAGTVTARTYGGGYAERTSTLGISRLKGAKTFDDAPSEAQRAIEKVKTGTFDRWTRPYERIERLAPDAIEANADSIRGALQHAILSHEERAKEPLPYRTSEGVRAMLPAEAEQHGLPLALPVGEDRHEIVAAMAGGRVDRWRLGPVHAALVNLIGTSAASTLVNDANAAADRRA